MNTLPKSDLPENKSQSFFQICKIVLKAPRKELIQFVIFLFALFLQWCSLLQMCETEGRFGTLNFFTTMALCASIGLVFSILSTAHKLTVTVSSFAMCLYFLEHGW